MKKHLPGIGILLLFMVGAALMLYPMVSDLVNRHSTSRVITGYHNAVAQLNLESLQKDVMEAERYNLALAQTPEAFYKPALLEGYDDILNITSGGIMGYIEIEKIGVELPIYHGVSKEVLQTGIGHLPGTSFPVGGASTHAVLSGHRGLPSAKLFSDLDKLEEGDIFYVTVHDRVLKYVVDQVKIVLPTEVQDLMIEKGKDYCTLLTCTPYGINTHRLLVRGVRDFGKAGEVNKTYVANEAFRIDPLLIAAILAVPLLLLAFVAVFFIDRRK